MLFEIHSYKRLSRHIGSISHLQPIILPSLTHKPTNVIHLWNMDRGSTQVCAKHSGLINLVAIVKVSLEGGNRAVISTVLHGISQYKMVATHALSSSHLKTY